MKKIILISILALCAFSAIANTHCIEQAEEMAKAVYDLNMKPADIRMLNKVNDLGNFNYEFIFVEGMCVGTKITVNMEPLSDPGTQCNLKSLFREDLRFTELDLCN